MRRGGFPFEQIHAIKYTLKESAAILAIAFGIFYVAFAIITGKTGPHEALLFFVIFSVMPVSALFSMWGVPIGTVWLIPPTVVAFGTVSALVCIKVGPGRRTIGLAMLLVLWAAFGAYCTTLTTVM